MNKKQLIIILVAGLLSSTASALNLNSKAESVPGAGDAVPAGTVVIANEVDFPSGTITVDGNDYDVTGEAGFIIPSNSGYFARFDLGGGATFASALTVAGLGEAQIAAGGVDEDYAVLSVGGSSLIALGADWTLSGTSYKLVGKEDVTFAYSIYQDAGDAVNERDALQDSQSGTLISYMDATKMEGAAATSLEIDVASGGLRFDDGTGGTSLSSPIMVIKITNTGMGTNPIDNGPPPNLESIVDDVTLTVTGDFSAINLGDAEADPVVAPAGKVWLDKTPACNINTAAIPATDDAEAVDAVPMGDNLGLLEINEFRTKAEVELPVSNPARTINEYAVAYVCMMVDGKSEIPEGSYSGRLVMTANDDFDPIEIDGFDGSELKKNSDSVQVHLLLTPGGHFSNYIRLSNTLGVPVSNLMVTLYNDAGDYVRFGLDEVEGLSDGLGPQASTSLININVLYAAAQAADREEDEEMFTVTGGEFGNKLRARIDGSFQTGAINIQVLSLSTDKTTFFSF